MATRAQHAALAKTVLTGGGGLAGYAVFGVLGAIAGGLAGSWLAAKLFKGA